MADIALRAELMRSLGRLVRGLSALFWGLPITLITCVYVATNEWVKPLHMFAPIAATGLLYYGLNQLGSFQKQERIWHESLERAKVIAFVNVGLSPFIYWYNRLPTLSFYELALFFLMLMGLIFLFTLNHVLQRLAAMLPDFLVRAIHFFQAIRYWLLIFLILLPLAMTMTLIWKIKEVIFASVFSHES